MMCKEAKSLKEKDEQVRKGHSDTLDRCLTELNNVILTSMGMWLNALLFQNKSSYHFGNAFIFFSNLSQSFN